MTTESTRGAASGSGRVEVRVRAGVAVCVGGALGAGDVAAGLGEGDSDGGAVVADAESAAGRSATLLPAGEVQLASARVVASASIAPRRCVRRLWVLLQAEGMA